MALFMQTNNIHGMFILYLAFIYLASAFIGLLTTFISFLFIVPQIEKKYKIKLEVNPLLQFKYSFIGAYICCDIFLCYLKRKRKPRYQPIRVLYDINYKIEKEKKIIIIFSFIHIISTFIFGLSFALWIILYFGFDWR